MHKLTTFRPYLEGQQFKIFTDYEPLRWLEKFSKVKDHILERWEGSLAQFQFSIQHIKDSENTVADRPSRVLEDGIVAERSHIPDVSPLRDSRSEIKKEEPNRHDCKRTREEGRLENRSQSLSIKVQLLFPLLFGSKSR